MKSRYSSPVDHRSLDDLCTSTYTMSQKLYARYTLGARYLYFKRNVEKLYVRCALSVGKYGNLYCAKTLNIVLSFVIDVHFVMDVLLVFSKM